MTRLFAPMRKAHGLPLSKRDFSEQHACLGKVSYARWRDAETATLRIIEENIDAGTSHRSGGLGVYRCDFCANWHVGHSRGPRQYAGFESRYLQKRENDRRRRAGAAPSSEERD